MDEKRLIKECQKNNRKAQSELFHTYKDRLFALCLKYCNNFDEAEDNLQDSFLAILKKINQYNFKGSFEGWMKKITIHKAIDRYKKDFVKNIDLKEELIQDTNIDYEEFNFSLDELLKLIQELPSKYRLVFSLYELDNYSHKEIAEMLQISEGTSKSNLHRAKVLLKTKVVSVSAHKKKTLISNGY
ncbi:RNA polymerase sigma factor [Aquimarina sp. MMG016]|uniref:RNA polymerase sigma factor n=1 Tax=Aquimarina sp. MMG016 TaxID=2822690 RepID=UPI001B3A3358|nr:RNA polymerase sigma factor [Aquimarina sp. MMG016]MBQ4822326.1 RNA polymerase sigma factor [Aquimarina sp. MMG016]